MRPLGPGTKAAAVIGAALAAAALRRSIRRVEVFGSSMAPALLPGDRLIVVARRWNRSPPPVAGQIVALTDPREPGRTLVKRVRSVDAADGTLEVEGDSPDASTDSRTFGPVPMASVLGRAVYRYAPPDRRGPLSRPGEYDRA